MPFTIRLSGTFASDQFGSFDDKSGAERVLTAVGFKEISKNRWRKGEGAGLECFIPKGTLVAEIVRGPRPLSEMYNLTKEEKESIQHLVSSSVPDEITHLVFGTINTLTRVATDHACTKATPEELGRILDSNGWFSDGNGGYIKDRVFIAISRVPVMQTADDALNKLFF